MIAIGKEIGYSAAYLSRLRIENERKVCNNIFNSIQDGLKNAIIFNKQSKLALKYNFYICEGSYDAMARRAYNAKIFLKDECLFEGYSKFKIYIKESFWYRYPARHCKLCIDIEWGD